MHSTVERAFAGLRQGSSGLRRVRVLCLGMLFPASAFADRLASLFKWIFIISGLVSDTQLHVCTFSSPLDTHQWPFSVGQEASVPRCEVCTGASQGARRAQGPSDDIVSKALGPVEVLNAFSLEIMTPQTLQTHRSFWPWKPPRALYYVARGGERWLGPDLYPQRRNPHPQAGGLPAAAATSAHTLTLGATSTLLCGDKAESGAGTVRPLDELAPTLFPPFVS